MAEIQKLLGLSDSEFAIHIIIFVINILLLIFAKPLINAFQSRESETKNKVRILRFLNILVLALHLLDLLLLSLNIKYEQYFVRIGSTFIVLYIGLYLFSILSYFSRKRFGSEKKIDDKKIFFDTYSSRLINIIALVIIVFSCLYALIKIWGADSMLETTGIFGIFVAFLAFTSNVWAPDIISGLIILNSQLLEDGDVVMIHGSKDEYIITKVSFIYVILYDVRNNHRTLIKNSQFLHSKIENLSRVASTEGIRQSLTYKIGYPNLSNLTPDERQKSLDRFYAKIERMFNTVNEVARNREDIKINNNRDFEWALTSAGDYALEFTLWFCLERLPNTKLTSTIRVHLMGTVYKINEQVFRASITEGLDLSTPVLTNVSASILTEEAKEIQQSSAID